MDLTDRVALVTGGGTGLGQAIVLELARQGARVAVNYSRSQAEAEETAEAARVLGNQALAVRADVSDEAAVHQMIARVISEWGRLDVLVNNAGVTRYVPLTDVDAVRGEDFDRILAVNVKGTFLCTQAAAPHLRANGVGKVVNIASSSAFPPPEGSSIPYIVSKAGLVMLTACLAKALAPGIQVNCVAPGWMETRWLQQYFPPDVQRALLDDPTVPKADLADVARAVVHLAQNDSVTGQTLVVDKGAQLG
jgi:3-oxoacyl-[acyl-carrier protein] reductase